ncbi:MAG: mercuric transporter MerT family protein [Gemmatimonadota bacterium]
MTGAAGAAIGSLAASVCCVGPIGISLLGVQGAIFAAGLRPYRFWLLGGSALFLGVALWAVYRPVRAIACAESCRTEAGRWNRRIVWGAIGLWLFAVALQFVADFFWY